MLLLPQTTPAGDQFDDFVEAIQVFNAVQVGVGGTCQADDLGNPRQVFPHGNNEYLDTCFFQSECVVKGFFFLDI